MILVYNKHIILISHDTSVKIDSNRYIDILQYYISGIKSDFVDGLIELGFEQELLEYKEKLCRMMNYSFGEIGEDILPIPMSFNIELTTACPLRCPQCFCHLEHVRHIDIGTAKKYVREAADLGINFVNLSGGETLYYPFLYELLEECQKQKLIPSLAISGVGFNKKILLQMKQVGNPRICVSLNGSINEINSVTRDGYNYAIKALELLYNNQYENVCLNWVAFDYNINDFKEIINLARRYEVKKIVVLAAKPDVYKEIDKLPKKESFAVLYNFIKNYGLGSPEIEVEHCYGSLNIALYSNASMDLKCAVGRRNFSINVDGNFSPCRHIEVSEEHDNILDYWRNSDFLNSYRETGVLNTNCVDCKHNLICNSCLAMEGIEYKCSYKELFSDLTDT